MNQALNSFAVMLALALILIVTANAPARAGCVCRCVNGQNIPICSNSLDLRPLCPPRICPLTPPAVRPLQMPTLPPLGTTRCEKQQVWNPYTARYEWRTLCQ